MTKYAIRYLFLFSMMIMLHSQLAYSQVEHNYPVGPQYTNCDSLDISLGSLVEMIESIENSKFRFQQQFKISKTYGIMNARFYSCDGENGFLIMKVDKKDLLYLEVPKAIWDTLITSADINAYYTAEIRDTFAVIMED